MIDHADRTWWRHAVVNHGFRCIVNLSTEPIRLWAAGTALLTNGPLDGILLPSDTAIWLGL